MTETPQEMVYQSVIVARGYGQKLTPEEICVRQISKLAEELVEIAEHTDGAQSPFWEILEKVSPLARVEFDEGEHKSYSILRDEDAEALKQEMADAQVVLFVMAQAYTLATGEEFDILQAAVAKALRDERRGVR